MDNAAIVELVRRVSEFQEYAWNHHVWNYWAWFALVTASLVLIALAAGAALWKTDAKLAGTFTIVNGFVIGFQSAFAFGDAAQFYRVASSDAQVLLYDLKNPTTESLKQAQEDYRKLMARISKDLPIGSGMAAAQGSAAKK